MMKRISKVLLVGLVSVLVVQAVASATTVPVSVTAVESRRASVSLTGTNPNTSLLNIRRDLTTTSRSTKSWIKFDLSSIYAANPGWQGNISAATLTIYLGSARTAASADLWGINNTTSENAGWTATSITWWNAPGNDVASITALDTAEATLIFSQYAVTGVQFAAIQFVGQELINFLNQDLPVEEGDATDGSGIVQFALANSTGETVFLAHTHGTTIGGHAAGALAPTLTVIPEPATLVILGLGGLLLRRRFA
ncbi:MAG TPA: PEP-CTERM sorting domain-containing protein [Sedimentisphaerales bacterium]|nr:PEP-CTERM sorting domain-containing protein [Sedimentisphaerales bacterium]